MTDTVIISDEKDNAGEAVEDAVEELTEAVEDAVEELTEAVEDAVEELTETVEELETTAGQNEDKLSWLVNSVSTMQEQMATVTEAIATMAALLIPPPLPEPEPGTIAEAVEVPMNTSETMQETSSTVQPDDQENDAPSETMETLENQVRRIIVI